MFFLSCEHWLGTAFAVFLCSVGGLIWNDVSENEFLFSVLSETFPLSTLVLVWFSSFKNFIMSAVAVVVWI